MTTSSGGKRGYVDGQEPTMEEILGSIRRIIAEDSAPPPAARVEPQAEPVRELDQTAVDAIVEPPAEILVSADDEPAVAEPAEAEVPAVEPPAETAVTDPEADAAIRAGFEAIADGLRALDECQDGGVDSAADGCCGCGGCACGGAKDGPIDLPPPGSTDLPSLLIFGTPPGTSAIDPSNFGLPNPLSFLFPDEPVEERPADEADLDAVPPEPEPEQPPAPKPPRPDEPSMEEILASIRRIISEDGEPATPPKPKLDLPTRAIVMTTTHEVNTQVWPSCFECRWFDAEQAMDPCRHSHAKPWTSLERKLVGIGLKAFRPAACPLRPDKPVLGD